MDYEQNVSHRVFGTPEVAQLVIEYLGDEQQSLHNLRLVSKQFNSLSVRECYRSLSLNMSRSKSLRLVKFMLAEPQYLGFVHEISVHACSSVFEAYWAVDSGENARAKESKYLSRLSSILMAFIQRIPRVRKFKYAHILRLTPGASGYAYYSIVGTSRKRCPMSYSPFCTTIPTHQPSVLFKNS